MAGQHEDMRSFLECKWVMQSYSAPKRWPISEYGWRNMKVFVRGSYHRPRDVRGVFIRIVVGHADDVPTLSDVRGLAQVMAMQPGFADLNVMYHNTRDPGNQPLKWSQLVQLAIVVATLGQSTFECDLSVVGKEQPVGPEPEFKQIVLGPGMRHMFLAAPTGTLSMLLKVIVLHPATLESLSLSVTGSHAETRRVARLPDGLTGLRSLYIGTGHVNEATTAALVAPLTKLQFYKNTATPHRIAAGIVGPRTEIDAGLFQQPVQTKSVRSIRYN